MLSTNKIGLWIMEPVKQWIKKLHITKRHIWAFAGVIVLALIAWAAYLRFVKVYPWADWTGFGDYTGPLTKDQRGKTLWDWMELLIIPAVLAIGATLFNQAQKANELKIAELRNKNEREIAADQQREAALKAYIENMTELLLHEDLRNSEPDHELHEVGIIARTRTLSTLRILDGTRKGILLLFLYEAELINGPDPVIDLSGADLTKADLSGANPKGPDLSGADLTKADLSEANLKGAYLKGAYLSRALLYKANLSGTNLRGANLSGANLDVADLSGASLSRSNLSGAGLGWANLSNAGVIDEQLASANSLQYATMPDGKKYDPTIHTNIAKLRKEHDTPPTPDAAPNSPLS